MSAPKRRAMDMESVIGVVENAPSDDDDDDAGGVFGLSNQARQPSSVRRNEAESDARIMMDMVGAGIGDDEELVEEQEEEEEYEDEEDEANETSAARNIAKQLKEYYEDLRSLQTDPAFVFLDSVTGLFNLPRDSLVDSRRVDEFRNRINTMIVHAKEARALESARLDASRQALDAMVRRASDDRAAMQEYYAYALPRIKIQLLEDEIRSIQAYLTWLTGADYYPDGTKKFIATDINDANVRNMQNEAFAKVVRGIDVLNRIVGALATMPQSVSTEQEYTIRSLADSVRAYIAKPVTAANSTDFTYEITTILSDMHENAPRTAYVKIVARHPSDKTSQGTMYIPHNYNVPPYIFDGKEPRIFDEQISKERPEITALFRAERVARPATIRKLAIISTNLEPIIQTASNLRAAGSMGTGSYITDVLIPTVDSYTTDTYKAITRENGVLTPENRTAVSALLLMLSRGESVMTIATTLKEAMDRAYDEDGGEDLAKRFLYQLGSPYSEGNYHLMLNVAFNGLETEEEWNNTILSDARVGVARAYLCYEAVRGFIEALTQQLAVVAAEMDRQQRDRVRDAQEELRLADDNIKEIQDIKTSGKLPASGQVRRDDEFGRMRPVVRAAIDQAIVFMKEHSPSFNRGNFSVTTLYDWVKKSKIEKRRGSNNEDMFVSFMGRLVAYFLSRASGLTPGAVKTGHILNRNAIDTMDFIDEAQRWELRGKIPRKQG